MNQYSLMCSMLPKNRVDDYAGEQGFSSFTGHVTWIGEEWDQQRELTEEEQEEWYEEPKELKF